MLCNDFYSDPRIGKKNDYNSADLQPNSQNWYATQGVYARAI